MLLSTDDVERALEYPRPFLPSRDRSKGTEIGNLVAAAAQDSAFRSFSTTVPIEGTERPITVSEMALVFDSELKASRTFDVVARAAHLRTKLGECSVAVETVTVPSGLVSYWGYTHLGDTILVLTMDTLDPQRVSMSDFRSLITAASERLELTHP